MAYFTPKPFGENSGRRRVGGICALASCIVGLAGLAVYITTGRLVGINALESAGLLMIVAAELRFPGFAICFVLLTGPIFAVLQSATDNTGIWRTWQYWVATAICCILGASGLVWLERKYRRTPNGDIT